MPILDMGKTSAGVVLLAAKRVYRFTPPSDCTINIGPEPAGKVQHNCKYAQLRAGVTYEFVTNDVDTTLSGLSRLDKADATPEKLDYINDKPAPVVAAVDEPK